MLTIRDRVMIPRVPLRGLIRGALHAVVTAAIAIGMVWADADRDCGFALMALGLGAAIGMARSANADGGGAERFRSVVPRQTAAVASALVAAGLVTFGGWLLGTRTHIPLPLLTFGSVLPAIGLVPWMVRATGKMFAGVVLSAFLVALTKLAACGVVRIVYGPEALEEGYMSGDWQAAPLMISLFWTGTVLLSVGGLFLPARIGPLKAMRQPAAA